MVGHGYSYYICRGRSDPLRIARGERCTARYASSEALDSLVWEDLCKIISTPELIAHALERAQSGEWLPQALQSRKETLSKSLKQLERQQERLLEVYLGEVIDREEFQRKRRELVDTQNALHRQLRQLEAQVQKKLNVAELASGIGDFCERIHQTLSTLTFEQRRELVTLLIDRVVVDDEKVEIHYAIPISPAGEEKLFCHLRTDYLVGLLSVYSLNSCFSLLMLYMRIEVDAKCANEGFSIGILRDHYKPGASFLDLMKL
jgi:site-specific DNA recombinase